jgi:hypothetical protein
MFTADSFIFIDDVTAYINNPRMRQFAIQSGFADFGVENA